MEECEEQASRIEEPTGNSAIVAVLPVEDSDFVCLEPPRFVGTVPITTAARADEYMHIQGMLNSTSITPSGVMDLFRNLHQLLWIDIEAQKLLFEYVLRALPSSQHMSKYVLRALKLATHVALGLYISLSGSWGAIGIRVLTFNACKSVFLGGVLVEVLSLFASASQCALFLLNRHGHYSSKELSTSLLDAQRRFVRVISLLAASRVVPHTLLLGHVVSCFSTTIVSMIVDCLVNVSVNNLGHLNAMFLQLYKGLKITLIHGPLCAIERLSNVFPKLPVARMQAFLPFQPQIVSEPIHIKEGEEAWTKCDIDFA